MPELKSIKGENFNPDITLDAELKLHTDRIDNPHNVTVTTLGIENVENVALSTWEGSSFIENVGTITTGVWNGTAIEDDYISGASNWNSAYELTSDATSDTTVSTLMIRDASGRSRVEEPLHDEDIANKLYVDSMDHNNFSNIQGGDQNSTIPEFYHLTEDEYYNIFTRTLQQSYDSSTTPEILTDSTRGAVSFKRGSTADTDNVIEVLNNSDVRTHAVTGNGNVILPKTSGVGFKVDTTTPTFGWKDLIGHIVVDTVGANAARLFTYEGGNVREYAFAATDKCDFRFHIPHDWVPGTNMYIHIHWSHNGTAITGTGTFSCSLSHSYAKGYNQASFSAEKTLTCSDTNVTTANTPQYLHKITEIQLSDIGGTGNYLDTSDIEVDGLILINLTVDTIPTITGGTPNEPFIHFVDIHYQSTQMTTKDKNYPFYT